jgi:hypothetical protein
MEGHLMVNHFVDIGSAFKRSLNEAPFAPATPMLPTNTIQKKSQTIHEVTIFTMPRSRSSTKQACNCSAQVTHLTRVPAPYTYVFQLLLSVWNANPPQRQRISVCDFASAVVLHLAHALPRFCPSYLALQAPATIIHEGNDWEQSRIEREAVRAILLGGCLLFYSCFSSFLI